jgi:GTPase-activating protein BEM2
MILEGYLLINANAQLLRKLYITLQPIGSSPSVTEYIYIANARSEVLKTIKEWLTLGGGAQDVLDDPQLFDGINVFLDNHPDHSVYEGSNFEDANAQEAWASLAEVKRSLYSSFVSQAMRPLTTRGPPIRRRSVNGAGVRSRNLSTKEPPDVDRIEPEDFVDNMDSMACAAFSNVTEEVRYRPINFFVPPD